MKYKQLNSSGKSIQNKKKFIIVIKSEAPLLGLAKFVLIVVALNCLEVSQKFLL